MDDRNCREGAGLAWWASSRTWGKAMLLLQEEIEARPGQGLQSWAQGISC